MKLTLTPLLAITALTITNVFAAPAPVADLDLDPVPASAEVETMKQAANCKYIKFCRNVNHQDCIDGSVCNGVCHGIRAQQGGSFEPGPYKFQSFVCPSDKPGCKSQVWNSDSCSGLTTAPFTGSPANFGALDQIAHSIYVIW